MAQNSYYDNTRLSTYKVCPRSYYYRHIRGWRRAGLSAPLAFGLSWHAAMDVIWGLAGKRPDEQVIGLAYHKFCETWEKEGMPPANKMGIEEIEKWEPRTPMVAAEMLVAYLAKRKEFIMGCDEIISIEQPFATPLYPGDENYDYYIGRIDKVVRNNGRIYPIEHKTTSMYVGRAPNHQLKYDYVEQWSLNAQVDGYLNATFMHYGSDVKAVYVDAALVHKNTHDVFKFIPVERAHTQLDAWLFDARDWVARVEFDKTRLKAYRDEVESTGVPAKIMPSFPKNTESCQGKYNSTCGYFDLCRYVENPEHVTLPEGFIEEFWNPFELLEISKVPGHDKAEDGAVSNV